MTTLYKRDSVGKIRVLNISTEGADLVQESGILDGGLVINRKTCKGKNIGKSNETTPESQAISEMESKITEKLKEDYFRTIEEAQTVVVVLPMLAKSFDDYGKKIVWGIELVFMQPKLDGMRALGTTGPNATLTSREGSRIETMDHILAELRLLPEGFILDGELYAHGKSFQENMRLIKKVRPGETEQVNYHLYDLVSTETFIKRYEALSIVVCGEHLKLVDTERIVNLAQLHRGHALNLNEGFEGSIVRWGSVPYKINGRSENLLKYKDFKDIALPILDIIPSDARPDWGQAIYFWDGAKGHPIGDNILGSGMKLSHDERKEWLINKQNYIGKTAELRFFEYSESGVPRFPVTVGIRLDK